MDAIHSAKKRVFCLVTVDGDLRLGNDAQKRAGITAMRRAHAELGLLGKTSWFINENDFCWTERHADYLLDLADTAECIGVHDHQDSRYLVGYRPVCDLMRASRTRLADFYRSHGAAVSLEAHRNGCALQSRILYEAAIALGYRLVSDVRPATAWYARMVQREGGWVCLGEGDPDAILTDNRPVPLGAAPWRHDDDNWMDYSSRQGRLLHVPITTMPMVSRERVQEAIDRSLGPAFVLVDTHPYDLQDPITGEVCAQAVGDYVKALEWMGEAFEATFIRMDQVEAVLERGYTETRGSVG